MDKSSFEGKDIGPVQIYPRPEDLTAGQKLGYRWKLAGTHDDFITIEDIGSGLTVDISYDLITEFTSTHDLLLNATILLTTGGVKVIPFAPIIKSVVSNLGIVKSLIEKLQGDLGPEMNDETRKSTQTVLGILNRIAKDLESA